jgi:hypothetical protein
MAYFFNAYYKGCIARYFNAQVRNLDLKRPAVLKYILPAFYNRFPPIEHRPAGMNALYLFIIEPKLLHTLGIALRYRAVKILIRSNYFVIVFVRHIGSTGSFF